ncbi:bcl-2 homologous antagonist/killer-like isoform X2 [Narcine bancroftii]|uniref:bcl-2 homologous antagonist/killer-like isoform X2 n=1 Tax=Narcine bancroftii TaxID=1343680 RepID=UPI0038310467
MASGNEGDSCSSCSPDGKKTNKIDTDQDKVEEAEDIFQNNVYCQYQNVAEANLDNGVTMPGTPMVTNHLQAYSSSSLEIGRQLAIIGDELNKQKNQELQSRFARKINWRQTITLPHNGVRYVSRRGIMEYFDRITEMVAKIIEKNQITQWIAGRGGWTTALSIETTILKWLFGIFMVAVLGVAIGWKMYKP